MNNTWYDIYLDEIKKSGSLIDYFNEKISTKKELISLIEKYFEGGKIIEMGSGTSVVPTYTASLGYDSYALDKDKNMLTLSGRMSYEYNKEKTPKFIEGSVFETKFEDEFFDVAYSNGVLEHFSDEDIIKALKEEMRISKTLIVGIPTRYFNKSEAYFGDERFLPIRFWRKKIKEAGGVIIEERSNHFLPKKKILLNFKKYFRPYPFRLFVVKKI